ncbi:GntR family transcriptional regulator [Paracoccus suum]|uniref:GntR family transcriptional regulator n=1 Tax=Paracoccus suum TaxID=2259340 RepID=UPI0018EF7D4F|nr:GntR family transcriptional regulator [Paracoccus suum]
MDQITAERGKGANAAEIGERIWLAIAEGRLRPGTRLKEEELAEIFAVNRARVRQALADLSREGLVTIVPNRGAFVAAPSVEEAADVFYARHAIERRVVERLAAAITPAAVAELRELIAEERRASADSNIPDVIRLSGRFHIRLAELVGTDFLATIMRDLVARSSLITAVYRDTAHFNCGPDEHGAIVDCLARGDGAGAVEAMGGHLAHLESELHLSPARIGSADLRSALG